MRCEGNHAPLKGVAANPWLWLLRGDDNGLKMNRFHEELGANPRRSWLNSRNGKIRSFLSSPFCVIVGAISTESPDSGGAFMTFDEILAQIIDLLQRQGRVSYGALKRRFDLDDDYVKDLKDEILYVYPVREDEGRGLVWTGDTPGTP